LKPILHNIFGIINKHGWITFLTLALLATLTSTLGFTQDAGAFHPIMIAKGLVQSFADLPSDENFFLIFGKLLWMLAFMSAAVSVFLKEWSYKQLISYIQSNPHVAVIGICDIEHNYVEDLDKEETLIYNCNNDRAAMLSKENGFVVQNTNLSKIVQDLYIENIKIAIINTGKDRDDINTAFNLIEKYLTQSCTHKLRLIVRIENRELDSLFRTNSIFDSDAYTDSKIEIKTYSFYEECASKLFQDHFIDGPTREYIDSQKPYSIVIHGDGELAQKIVYEAAKIAHLPNQNQFTIHLVAENADALKDDIIKTHTGIELIETLNLETHNLNYNDMNFYTDTIWHKPNITNTIICFDNEDINLEIAAALQAKTYLRTPELKTKILFGVFNQGAITKTIDTDTNYYKNFIPFGNSDDILTRENIFDDTNNLLAKFINYTYTGFTNDGAYDSQKLLNGNREDVLKAWFPLEYTKQLSSLAQAKHIKIKLKALGTVATKSLLTSKELLEENRKVLSQQLDCDYEGTHSFPEDFDSTFFDKLTRMEHNRWSAYHYLNGWEYKQYLVGKELKMQMHTMKYHNCLIPLQDFPSTQFSEDEKIQEKTTLEYLMWDIYSFMYLPNYLAEAGYVLEKVTNYE